MRPTIEKVPHLSEEHSVICIIGSDALPPELKLSKMEMEYLRRCLADKQELVTINLYSRLVVIVKEKSEMEPWRRNEETRRAGASVAELLKQYKHQAVSIMRHGASPESPGSLVEGMVLSSYKFCKYKNECKKDSFSIYPEKIMVYDAGFEADLFLSTVTEAVYFARDLVNEPSNHLNATLLARRISEFVAPAGVRSETFSKKKIESLKMGGLMAVNLGSPEPPTFTILEWKPEKPKNDSPVVLVGKGVVFDSGGLNLKPTNYIEDMKADMAGGAVVASVIYMIARMGLPLHVIAMIPATDNRPGENAIAPGDVITLYNNKSVEVMNTDAEGRLILADSLAYAENFKPGLVITVATLTGSAANAFGSLSTAVMGNASDELFGILSESGEREYERVTRMPFYEEYGELLKSEIADLKNIGPKEAGAITAGKFLENFTASPFMHLDIAGVSILSKEEKYRPRGGTGTGVRLLYRFLEAFTEKNLKLKSSNEKG